MRIAYLVNQYPKVSHAFIRREILALERQGNEVLRIALRGWDGDVVDVEDQAEQRCTRYVLQGGPLPLAAALAGACLRSPVRFAKALALAWRMGRRADRPLPYHLIYLAEACRMLPWLKQAGIEHLHAHFGTNSAEVAMLAHELGGPAYSFTVHGPDEFDRPQFLHLGEKIKRAAFVVGVSSYGRSQLYRWVPHGQWPKIQVVHCGLEAAFHEVPEAPLPDAPRLVCVGRLCEQKGQLLLVEAAARLAAKGVDFELVLAGDGELRAEIEAGIRRHQLAGRVTITGWISSDEVRSRILASRALVLPSFAEGLPVVIMEAMALRRPVLTTYVAGIPELVRDGQDGWLFPAGSIDAVVTGMEQALAATPAQLAEMGRSARERVLARHSIDVEAAKLSGMFHDAIVSGLRQNTGPTELQAMR
ncbi:MAG TPA: glycosyltransferase family 4 protein [Rhodocyclaceae bacterium]